MGQFLHRCAGLGGDMVASTAGSSPTDGPLFVGGDLCIRNTVPFLSTHSVRVGLEGVSSGLYMSNAALSSAQAAQVGHLHLSSM